MSGYTSVRPIAHAVWLRAVRRNRRRKAERVACYGYLPWWRRWPEMGRCSTSAPDRRGKEDGR